MRCQIIMIMYLISYQIILLLLNLHTMYLYYCLGDFNSRTNIATDFADIFEHEGSILEENPHKHFFEKQGIIIRANEDNHLNNNGRKLIELCKISDLYEFGSLQCPERSCDRGVLCRLCKRVSSSLMEGGRMLSTLLYFMLPIAVLTNKV